MDHAEVVESEGHAPQNEIADDPLLRGNSTEHTEKSMADGDNAVAAGDGNDRAAVAQELADVSMGAESAGVEMGTLDIWSAPAVASATAAEPSDTTASLMSTMANATTAYDPVVGVNQTTEQPTPHAGPAVHREQEQEASLNRVRPAGPSVDSADGSVIYTVIGTKELSKPNDSRTPKQSDSIPLGAYSSEHSSFDQGQEMSVDEEENDTHSDKASSVDAENSDPDVPLDQNQASQLDKEEAVGVNERSPLEDTYGPFIQPTDTCLADARERLHVALEQTRLLRACFTEQAYDRYRCVMKPVPESINDIIEPIHADPHQAALVLREQAEAIKAEKNMEKKQAQQAGVGLEEIAYFGEGLHLVLLPGDEVDQSDIDTSQFPDRGPVDPETGERTEEISAAAAATTEQVFDRIRRIRAIRMGADIVQGSGISETATHLSRNLAQDQLGVNELFSPGFAIAPQESSPAPSVDSNASDNNQRSSKGSLDHLLTLSPDAEGNRPNGCFTAVQSALIARGIGMNEMKRDVRINPLHQRMFQSTYFSPSQSYKFLPPLLGPHQLYRLQAADARKEGIEIRTGARESIRSVVEEICSSVSKGKSLVVGDKPNDGISGDSGSGGFGRAMGEEHSTLEIGLLQRMRSTMLDNQKDKSPSAETSDGVSHLAAVSINPNVDSYHSDAERGEVDPLLAFSVMSAVGLVRTKEDNGSSPERADNRNSESAYAQVLGLDSLTGLQTVSNFFHTNSTNGNARKRRLSGTDVAMNDGKKQKTDGSNMENKNEDDDVVYQIRGGGRPDELNAVESNNVQKDTGEIKQKKNGVSQSKNKADAQMPDPSLAGYAGFDPLYNAMSQVPLGDKRSQSVIAAAAASRQLLQRQLGVHPDPYHTAALAQQLSVPIGSHLNSLPASDLSDFYLRNGLAGNPDWSALRAATSNTNADVLTQHPHLRTSLGFLPGQMSLGLPEQEAARAMLLREHHNAAAARAHEAVTAAAAARYQAALSSINPQHPFGFVASSLSQLRSNETQPISSLPAFHANQRKEMSAKKVQRQRALSLSENTSRNDGDKEVNGTKPGKADKVADTKRPASAPPSPPSFEANDTTPNGGSSTDVSSKKIVSHDEASKSESSFALPPPPKGLHKEVADLIIHAKFHEARSLSQQRSDESEALLIQFLLSLGAAVPIPKELIADPLEEKLSSPSYQLRLHEFVGRSKSACTSRDVIIAIISLWLWTEHQDCFKEFLPTIKKEGDPSYKWLINSAVDESLSALAAFFDSNPPEKSDSSTKETPNEQVAAIASQSLAKQVFVDHRADATFPILEELLKLLDSLRTDALQVKTQERVLLATLASRCGNMSEAFSNAYVSSIARAGVALGHENVCEIGQNEECRASTMLPYDFFHDNVGVWEEPCRPVTGYHPSVGADELKRQAHARSVIQKSVMMLQKRHSLKGGISDGGPYFTVAPVHTSSPSTPPTVPPLIRTLSGSMKRRGSHEGIGVPVAGASDTLFNPDHSVVPMHWKPNDVGNFPYGHYEPGDPNIIGEIKKRKLSHPPGGNDGEATSLALQHRSTQELEWEDVANMFFHGGSTRSIDINYDFGSSDHLGKKTIFAPFVRAFDRSSLEVEGKAESETQSDEDISDETIIQRHQDVLDEMKLKLDSALENRKHHSQQRGRKR
mmetsp:Transcript_44871/g.94135  ORF Transcript_44871/g.94135 Transcript_44871/m.94135 type:complete len:1659 (-) Transcript_44871:52-5028(-)